MGSRTQGLDGGGPRTVGLQRSEYKSGAAAYRTEAMGLQFAVTGEVACRYSRSCKALSGKVDGMGLLLGQVVMLVPLKTSSIHACVYRDLLRR